MGGVFLAQCAFDIPEWLLVAGEGVEPSPLVYETSDLTTLSYLRHSPSIHLANLILSLSNRVLGESNSITR